MRYDSNGLEAEHKEVVAWLDWRAKRMAAAGLELKVIQQWASLTAAWLSTGEQYLQSQSGQNVCPSCKGTGTSPLVLSTGPSPCHACGGSGVVADNVVLFPSKESKDAGLPG